MVQDEGPQPGRPRGLNEAPGLWSGEHAAGLSSSVVALSTRVRANARQTERRRLLLIGDDDETVSVVIELLSRLGSQSYEYTSLSHLPLSFPRSGPIFD